MAFAGMFATMEHRRKHPNSGPSIEKNIADFSRRFGTGACLSPKRSNAKRRGSNPANSRRNRYARSQSLSVTNQDQLMGRNSASNIELEPIGVYRGRRQSSSSSVTENDAYDKFPNLSGTLREHNFTNFHGQYPVQQQKAPKPQVQSSSMTPRRIRMKQFSEYRSQSLGVTEKVYPNSVYFPNQPYTRPEQQQDDEQDGFVPDRQMENPYLVSQQREVGNQYSHRIF